MRLGLRFDMRAPDIGAPVGELYAAAIDMAEWADELGFDATYFAEQHGAEDGHCPAPVLRELRLVAQPNSGHAPAQADAVGVELGQEVTDRELDRSTVGIEVQAIDAQQRVADGTAK